MKTFLVDSTQAFVRKGEGMEGGGWRMDGISNIERFNNDWRGFWNEYFVFFYLSSIVAWHSIIRIEFYLRWFDIEVVAICLRVSKIIIRFKLPSCFNKFMSSWWILFNDFWYPLKNVYIFFNLIAKLQNHWARKCLCQFWAKMLQSNWASKKLI